VLWVFFSAETHHDGTNSSVNQSLNSPRVKWGHAGCKVLGITISKEQLVEAQARVQAAGLKHLVDLRFCDYRHLPNAQGFDRVVSIEMIEAVRCRSGLRRPLRSEGSCSVFELDSPRQKAERSSN